MCGKVKPLYKKSTLFKVTGPTLTFWLDLKLFFALQLKKNQFRKIVICITKYHKKNKPIDSF